MSKEQYVRAVVQRPLFVTWRGHQLRNRTSVLLYDALEATFHWHYPPADIVLIEKALFLGLIRLRVSWKATVERYIAVKRKDGTQLPRRACGNPRRASVAVSDSRLHHCIVALSGEG